MYMYMSGKSLKSGRVAQNRSQNAHLRLMWFLKPQVPFDVQLLYSTALSFPSSDLSVCTIIHPGYNIVSSMHALQYVNNTH